MKSTYEIKGWYGHWIIFCDDERLLIDNKKSWFTKKSSAEQYLKSIK
jgi:hypothetical protein